MKRSGWVTLKITCPPLHRSCRHGDRPGKCASARNQGLQYWIVCEGMSGNMLQSEEAKKWRPALIVETPQGRWKHKRRRRVDARGSRLCSLEPFVQQWYMPKKCAEKCVKKIAHLGSIAGLTRGMTGQAGPRPRVHARHAFPVNTRFLQILNNFFKIQFANYNVCLKSTWLEVVSNALLSQGPSHPFKVVFYQSFEIIKCQNKKVVFQ